MKNIDLAFLKKHNPAFKNSIKSMEDHHGLSPDSDINFAILETIMQGGISGEARSPVLNALRFAYMLGYERGVENAKV